MATGVVGAVEGENPKTVPIQNPGATAAVNKGEVFTSYDVNAFEIPSGRDEEWRFTPLRRLRGLHDGTAVRDGAATIEVGSVEGVRVETVGRDDARLGQAGVPADRVAAQAYSGFDEATVVSVGAETEVAEPVVVTVTGPGEGKTAYGHLQIRLILRRRHGGDRPAWQRNLCRERGIRARRQRQADRRRGAGLGRRRRQRDRAPRRAGSRRDAAAHRGHPRRRSRPAHRHREIRRTGR